MFRIQPIILSLFIDLKIINNLFLEIVVGRNAKSANFSTFTFDFQDLGNSF